LLFEEVSEIVRKASVRGNSVGPPLLNGLDNGAPLEPSWCPGCDKRL